jgi:penicillin amidase
MRWTGFELNDPIEAFNKINRARNWEEFTKGVSEFAGPGQNFVYGDREGNIGYQCGVRLPIRGTRISCMPLPGWDATSEWKGFVPFERLPRLYNPPEGYIASANDKIVDDSYPYHISDLWEPPSRIMRLRDVLGRDDRFSPEDVERLQNDKFSLQAKALVPYILRACGDSSLVVPEKELVGEYLRNWNFDFGKDDIATSIFQEFLVRLQENIYKDEMGDEVFHDFVILANVPIRVTGKLMEEGTSEWFDNITTDTVETREDIVRESVREALAALSERFGAEMKLWRWGDLHVLRLRHPFGLQKPLDRIFNVGPFPYGGGSTALVSGEYSFNRPFEVTVGASFRYIVDLSKPGQARVILPTGQSGQALHKHYADQTPLWLHGAYHTMRWDDIAGRSEHLILEPAR